MHYETKCNRHYQACTVATIQSIKHFQKVPKCKWKGISNSSNTRASR